MAKTQIANVKQLYETLKTNRDSYMPLWKEISRYVGIKVDPQYESYGGKKSKSSALDTLIDDPTASLSVNQAGDYLQGIVWGTGDKILSLEPSEHIRDIEDPSLSVEFFERATRILLDQMNNAKSGLNAAMKSYFYDQMSFGTSGIGVFPNSEFATGREDNALVFRSYGVDNILIDEGANGLVETIFVINLWRVNRIVQEFAYSKDNAVDMAKFTALPKAVQDSYNGGDYNREYKVIQAIYPRHNYHPRLRGKRGAKYIGEWFLDEQDSAVFLTEDYKTIPIGVCRAIKVRGEVYGRSSGTILISSIKSVNYMFSKAIEVIEKMASVPLGVWNSSLFGDSVLDTSADGLTVFNEAMAGNAKSPVFPLMDIGDPAPLVQFLIPYLNDKIATGFKVDILLDFQSAKDMTATESMQRYAIRGRSLSGILQQQKTEMLETVVNRSISLSMWMEIFGIDPRIYPDVATQLQATGRGDQVIPDSVLQCIDAGKPWYKIKFNNELEKLSRTEAIERLIQVVNAIMMIMQAFPQIVHAVKWYELWRDVNQYLGFNYAVSEQEFKQIMEQLAQDARERMMMEAASAGAQITKDGANADKFRADAQKSRGGTAQQPQ